ncbi:MAG: substrate-binding protein [Thermodesulfobacteriota bacterium]
MKWLAAKALSFLLLISLLVCGAASAQEVVIGLNIPLTGPYAAQGKDQQEGFMLAIETLNAKGGVLGHQIRPVIKDSQSNPETARKNTLEMIWNENAAMISGGISSAVAIAVSAECQEQGVIFMTGLTHDNATTGHMQTPGGFMVQTAHRHTFRWFLNAWMSASAMAPYLSETYGKNKEYFYISADYSWGHSLEDSMRRFLELEGADTKGSLFTPLGSKDFKKELEQAKEAAPDILVLNLFGDDLVNALKQAYEMKVTKKMQVVVPLLEVQMAKALGPEILQGILATTIWHHSLESKYPGSKTFVDAFRKKFNRPPGVAAATGWVAVNQWADAVEKAKDFYADDKIILGLEGHKFVLLKDEEIWRAWDHQCMSSVFILKGKSPKKVQNEWDMLEIVAEKPGPGVMRSRDENPVSLEPLVIEE